MEKKMAAWHKDFVVREKKKIAGMNIHNCDLYHESCKTHISIPVIPARACVCVWDIFQEWVQMPSEFWF